MTSDGKPKWVVLVMMWLFQGRLSKYCIIINDIRFIIIVIIV